MMFFYLPAGMKSKAKEKTMERKEENKKRNGDNKIERKRED